MADEGRIRIGVLGLATYHAAGVPWWAWFALTALNRVRGG
jgi:hypothetical protein